jgi:hypothetical protein
MAPLLIKTVRCHLVFMLCVGCSEVQWRLILCGFDVLTAILQSFKRFGQCRVVAVELVQPCSLVLYETPDSS